MRVALLSYRSKPHCGGQGVYVRHLSRELVRLGHEEQAREPLIAQFLSDTEESLRVRLLIAGGLADNGWLVGKQHRPAFDQKLPEQFTIDRDGRLKKKNAS